MPGADVLLIGGGVASAACATELRARGFDGSIVLVGREADPPYERPPISKGYLRGAEGRAAVLVRPVAWWEQSSVELRTRTSVTKLDPVARTATLSTKEEVTYDRALLATGANVRRLPIEGADLDGIHYLRALRNADVLRDDVAEARAPEGSRVVLVGGSYIATEVAATLTAMGKRCSIVMQEDVVLSRGFGARAGRYFQELLEANGIEFHGGQDVVRFEGSGERVERVVCASGLVVDADAVVLGVGAVPDVMLARAAGLELGETGGVRCDSALRTPAEHLWAAGDVCEYASALHGRRVRVEHLDVAVEQGKHAARAMLGDPAPYAIVPYFFSDLADWAAIEYVGLGGDWDSEELRGSLQDGVFSVLYSAGERLVGALTVGRPEDLEEARRRIRAQADL